MSPEDLVGHEPEIVELAQRLPWKPLADERRRRLAAEVMAQADVAVVKSRRRAWAIAASSVALAASVVLVVGLRLGREHAAEAPSVAPNESAELVDTRVRATGQDEAPPAEAALADVHGI